VNPLYKRILGEEYSQLPQAVQALHDYDEQTLYRGVCNVQRGNNFLSNLCANILSLPKAGNNVEVEVNFSQTGNKEV